MCGQSHTFRHSTHTHTMRRVIDKCRPLQLFCVYIVSARKRSNRGIGYLDGVIITERRRAQTGPATATTQQSGGAKQIIQREMNWTTHRPLFVIIISVPVSWNSCHMSTFCRCTLAPGSPGGINDCTCIRLWAAAAAGWKWCCCCS